MTYRIPNVLPLQCFRTYDIRGAVCENNINEHIAYAIGLSVGSEALLIHQNKIIVACDVRLTGHSLKKALTTGLIETGCDVIDIGVGPTPLVYFATHFLPTKTGVMVTASHNPSDHNGFKIVLNGNTLNSDGIQNIAKRIIQREFAKGSGKITTQNIIPNYIDAICENLSLHKKMKIVIDAGNGAGSEIAPRVFKKLGCDVVPLFCEYDGRFPNHHPDPTIPENLIPLIDAVKKEKADIGLALDGDADRLGVVTNQGEIIWPDRQMLLYAKDVLKNKPGEKIIFDVKCSVTLPKIIQEYGGQPIMWRTGHSIIKAKMIAEKAPLAGEMSGHIFFKDKWFGFDDGIYVGARLLDILSREKGSVSDVFNALPKTINTPELKLPMTEEKKADFMQRLLTEGDFSDAQKITMDGLRVEYDFGWGLIRPSNTSPYLILRFEANTEDNLEKIKNIFRVQLFKLDAQLVLPF